MGQFLTWALSISLRTKSMSKRPLLKPVGTRRPSRQKKSVYLIICEGEKTEPNYFKEMRQFHRLSISIEICGTGCNTISLIEEARRIDIGSETDFDQVWCVFDKDDFTAENFNNAIFKANSYHYRVAWSNECFELWYLLHFKYSSANISRRQNL
jgi:RloB-like protein